ncbi:MAG TPA: hypothetical protein DCZ78_00015 [Blautia sp.]|uniref:Ig-like domain-containing protein n=1 Tax=Blautia sp. TaxID=1955243 RepID=UPI000E7DFF29|nr:hypothetical protein [Blautia sp.]HBB45229.1 hypothetical protein [Blautia sp.]
MKKTKCILPVLLAVLLIVLAPINTFAATKNVSVKASCGSVYVGSAKKIKVTATKGAKITYKALNSCVSVDSKGNVKGKKVGTGKVCLTASKKGYKTVKKTISVKIIKRNQKITAKNVTVNVGKTASLGASAKTGLKFKSSNNAVATVNSKGVVTGKKTGTAKITIYTNGNSVYNKASYTVTVKVTKHVHSYKKVVIPAKTHKVKHKEKGHWVEPKWVVDKPASKVVDVPEHDAFVCSVCGVEFSSNEEAEAHVASENSKHVLASKVNKVVHHDAVAEVSHQELVTPAQGWIICDGPNGEGCSEHFETPDDNAMSAHHEKYVNMQSEKMEEYTKQGMSVTDALERVDKEIPIHDITHVEQRPAVYKTVIDTPAQEAWDETLPDVYVFTCSCGATFESEEEFNAHVAENSKASVESKHVDATYKDVPEEGHYEGERTWVVDKKAYTETVVDSPEKVIYKCSCGAVKK